MYQLTRSPRSRTCTDCHTPTTDWVVYESLPLCRECWKGYRRKMKTPVEPEVRIQYESNH